MFDMVIRAGLVVTTEGVHEWDVAIDGERIAAVAAPGKLPAGGALEIDAAGKLVIPGGVDPHVHTGWRVPGPGATTNALPDQVSRAALFGGTTTLMDFAIRNGDLTIPQAIARAEGSWSESYCDYGLHVMLWGGAPPEVLPQISEAVSAGFPSFKVFMTDINPSRRGMMSPMGDILAVLEQLARHGGVLAVHAEDNDLVMYMCDRLQREGRAGLENMPLVHSRMAEELACRRIIGLARHVEGAAVYVLHVCSSAGVESIAEARAKGQPVYGETLHNYACFTSEAYLRPDGALYHTYPSLQSEEDTRRLWTGLKDGTMSTVATDESCTPRAIKVRSNTVFDTVGGHVGVETRLPIVYTEGVCKRGMSLERFVAATSTNAARIFGLYPRKGIIAPGSDADLVVFDPSVRKTLRAEELHGSDYSIWDGWGVQGWPSMVMLRGKVMVENGVFHGQPGDGRRASGKIADAIRNGPAV